MLKTHGRYDYSPISKRADYSWPEGKRLALHFSLNVEHFAFGQGLGNRCRRESYPAVES